MSLFPRRHVLVATAALALASLLPACSPYGALSPSEIQKNGVLILRAPPARAFKASLEALKGLGYEIAVEDPDKGLIVTKRKGLLELSAKDNANYGRQYTIEIKGAGGGSRVTATPAIFDNDTDVSQTKKLFDIEGPLGERELWKQLFAKIEQLL
jgi:hypothetical protein